MKKKNRYCVNLTMIHNGSIEVEADSENEAVEYVKENMDTIAPDELFSFGEKTADYADLIK